MPPVKSCHFGFTIHFIAFSQNLYSTVLPHLINQIRHGSYSVVSLSQPQFSENSNVLYFLPVSHSIDICIEAIKNIRNTHVVSTIRIPNFLRFIDKCSYNLQEIMKVSYIYSRILENPKVPWSAAENFIKTILPKFWKGKSCKMKYL